MKKKNKNTTFRFKQKLWYIYHAKDEYSIHSPFLFDLFIKAVKHRKTSLEKSLTSYLQQTMLVYSFSCNEKNISNIHSLRNNNDNIAIFIHNIRTCPNNLRIWQDLQKNNKQTCFFLDFFSFGVIIQSKNFKISQSFILKKR